MICYIYFQVEALDIIMRLLEQRFSVWKRKKERRLEKRAKVKEKKIKEWVRLTSTCTLCTMYVYIYRVRIHVHTVLYIVYVHVHVCTYACFMSYLRRLGCAGRVG